MRSLARRHLWLVALGAAGVALSACSPPAPADADATTSARPTATPTPSPQPTDTGPPSVSVTPADGSTGVGLDAQIQVTAVNASVSSVTVVENGATVSLDWTPGGNNATWTYAGGLDLNASYSITATALGAGGSETIASSAFHTIVSAKRLLTTVLDLSDGETVGIAMPVELLFNTPIPLADQAGIVAHLAVVSDPPQPGGWYWFDGEDLHYRPESFWQTGTQVTVVADLDDVDAGNGYWGLGNWSMSFSIGAAHVTVVDTQSRQMQVFDGDSPSSGQLLYTWATNTGKTGYETISGTLVVFGHVPVVVMNSCQTFHTPAACGGDPSDTYNEPVYDDTAVSTDGYFIHAAPWVCGVSYDYCDLYPYGDTNSSHGCINLSTDHAQIYYAWSQVGDPVEVVGSSLEASYSDGQGDWQEPWSAFVAGGQDVPSSQAPPPSAPPTNVALPTPSAVAGP
jgi:lipoprotein-anchoring transpeptidase ErfK/SrfK